MIHVLPLSFFDRPALTVARDLLGKALIRQVGKKMICGVITETEAYDGPQDKACHAYRGKTNRNAVMFGPAGQWYVYFVYGMHWMLNIVTGSKDYPAAVLIRGVGEWDGPAKLTKALMIDGRLNGKTAVKKSGLWMEDRGVQIPAKAVRQTPRIGVAYAEEWARKPYRFLLEGYNADQWVSSRSSSSPA
ncbi:MAG: DNA-3-methyladenine glycosylase [Candidatus Peribacteraceae bacterium]|nr:DNA-3-methyladenine glycosylase [Candidatus Peribacteraceae bacterium]MDD5742718.1 DNA-3-methyladenine glycosylase [Candidatus Peribacteraceae bacterium]